MNLYILPGRSWLRAVTLTNSVTGAPHGGVGYGAEFLINNEVVASTANGRCSWAGAGVLAIALTQSDTTRLLLNGTRFAWRLDVLDPNVTFDVDGFRQTLAEGTVCLGRSPVPEYTVSI